MIVWLNHRTGNLMSWASFPAWRDGCGSRGSRSQHRPSSWVPAHSPRVGVKEGPVPVRVPGALTARRAWWQRAEGFALLAGGCCQRPRQQQRAQLLTTTRTAPACLRHCPCTGTVGTECPAAQLAAAPTADPPTFRQGHSTKHRILCTLSKEP